MIVFDGVHFFWGGAQNKTLNVSPFHIFKHEMDYNIDIFGLSICSDGWTSSSLAWPAWQPHGSTVTMTPESPKVLGSCSSAVDFNIITILCVACSLGTIQFSWSPELSLSSWYRNSQYTNHNIFLIRKQSHSELIVPHFNTHSQVISTDRRRGMRDMMRSPWCVWGFH